MFRCLKQALPLLTRTDRRGLRHILLLSTIAGLVQTISVLSVLPFIILLAEPAALDTNVLLRQAYDLVGAESYHHFAVLFGTFAIVILAIGNLFLATENWFSQRFVSMLGHDLGKRLFAAILRQRYEFFAGHHSAVLTDAVLEQAPRVVNGIIGASIAVFTNSILVVFIVSMLMFVSMRTTLTTLAALVGLYLVIFALVRKNIEAHGSELTHLSESITRSVKETLDAIKEIKLRMAEAFFGRRFEQSSLRIARLEVRYNLLSFLPFFALETLIFAGLILLALLLLAATDSAGLSLSIVALYGMAAYRLIPALRAVFEGISTVHHNADALRVVSGYLEPDQQTPDQVALPRVTEEVRLSNVSYRYPHSEEDQLKDVTMTIPVHSSICLFGASGSGKSTILAVISGLLLPTTGSVTGDDRPVTQASLKSWRGKIGFLPQSLYLMDDSVASNIAFGVDARDIDHDRVIEVAKIAKLHDFVISELPQGYATAIGENGKKLSGGQRQRLGIARTLYHDPEILIFDESFSGIDQETRQDILRQMRRLTDKTLIFSTHEEAIAEMCDRIFVTEGGAVVESGRYQDLVSAQGRFTRLIADNPA